MKYLIIVSLLLISCSDFSSPEDINSYDIRQILSSMEDYFNSGDIDSLMNYFHIDFLHNGSDKNNEQTIWWNRYADFHTLEFTEIHIEIQSESYAIAEFNMHLISSDSTIITSEPSAENGDLSYFFREYSVWEIIGNMQEK